jgi:hypothetical protein
MCKPSHPAAIPIGIASLRWSGAWAARSGLTNGRPIIEIRLRTTRVADDQLGDLRGLSSLQSLDLIQTRISDAGLARLRGHDGLRSLLVYDTRVTDGGLEHIATMSGLERLLVGSCDVSGSGPSNVPGGRGSVRAGISTVLRLRRRVSLP